MLGSAKKFLSRFAERSVDEDAAAAGRTATDGGDQTMEEAPVDAAGEPSLYECPACEQVYVAVDKRTCATCDATVAEVVRTN